MLDTIYVEDCQSWISLWEQRSEHFGIKSHCFDSPESVLSALKNKEVSFPKVFVLDFDFDNSHKNGADLAQELMEMGYTGPLVMSSSITRHIDFFNLEIKKANVIEVIQEYFPTLYDHAKEKFLSLPRHKRSGPENCHMFALGGFNPFADIADPFEVEHGDEYVYIRIKTGLNPTKIPLFDLLNWSKSLDLEFQEDDFKNGGMEIFASSTNGNYIIWSHKHDISESELIIERNYFLEEEEPSELANMVKSSCADAIRIYKSLQTEMIPLIEKAEMNLGQPSKSNTLTR